MLFAAENTAVLDRAERLESRPGALPPHAAPVRSRKARQRAAREAALARKQARKNAPVAAARQTLPQPESPTGLEKRDTAASEAQALATLSMAEQVEGSINDLLACFGRLRVLTQQHRGQFPTAERLLANIARPSQPAATALHSPAAEPEKRNEAQQTVTLGDDARPEKRNETQQTVTLSAAELENRNRAQQTVTFSQEAGECERDPAANLSRKQLLAIESIMAGRSIAGTARLVGVAPNTVFRWMRENLDFQAYLNENRQIAQFDMETRMRLAAEQSLTRTVQAVEEGDLKTCLAIVKSVGLLSPRIFQSGPADRDELQLEHLLKQQELQVKREAVGVA